MPMDPLIKDRFEDDLERNLSSIQITYPPNHDKTITLQPLYLHSKNWSEDKTRIQGETNPVVLISYPREDEHFGARFLGDLGREIKIPAIDFKRADENPDSFDLVNDATDLAFTITINEYNIHHFELYTSLPSSDSSSRMIVDVENSDGDRIARRYHYNPAIGRNEWTKVEISIPYWLPTNTLTIRIREWGSFGDNPDGIRVHKNSGGDYLFRSYSYEMEQVRALWFSGIMRFAVFSKDKLVDATPSGNFIARQRVSAKILLEIQHHIVKYWKNFQTGAKFIRFEGSTNVAEFLDTEFVADAQSDVRLAYLMNVPIETFKVITDLEIKSINLL